MAQLSGFWTTGGATGHQQTSYSQAQLGTAGKIYAACAGFEGIAAGYLGELAGSVPANNTVRIATGGAMVDGRWYINDDVADVNIPSAVGAGNTRIDRIVVRCSWSGYQAIITRIAGVDAGTPVPPDITQESGSTYDLMLYQALVNTSGVVQLSVDERVWAGVQVDDSTIEIADRVLRVKNYGITNTKLRNSAGYSVIGKPNSGTGNPTDISGAVEYDVLRRGVGDVQWGKLYSANINDGAIKEANIDTDAVTTAKIKDANVTPAKTSFFNTHGANGAIYTGYATSGGTAYGIPSGWSITKGSTGYYEVTHNLGTTDYHVVASGFVNSARYIVVASRGSDVFVIRAFDTSGSSIDTAFFFIAIRY